MAQKYIKISLLILWLVIVITNSPALTTTTSISDTYWGANPTAGEGDKDVIGKKKYFQVNQLDVTYEPANLQYVDVRTRYLNNIDIYGGITELGDLFISTDGWNPYGSSHYNNDNFYNSGEVWEYALVLDDHTTNAGGDFTLYQITSDDIILSNDIGFNDTYRYGQEVQVNTFGLTALATGAWDVYNLGGGTDKDDYLRFDFSNLDYDFGTTNFGFHWTMTCGNDVIEGGAIIPGAVPEPGSLILLGSGLISFGVIKRLHKKKKKTL